MRREIIETLTNPDPGFVRILEKVPDSKVEVERKIIHALPKLQDMYIRKREAFSNKDLAAFQLILAEEIQFVRDLDQLAYHY